MAQSRHLPPCAALYMMMPCPCLYPPTSGLLRDRDTEHKTPLAIVVMCSSPPNWWYRHAEKSIPYLIVKVQEWVSIVVSMTMLISFQRPFPRHPSSRTWPSSYSYSRVQQGRRWLVPSGTVLKPLLLQSPRGKRTPYLLVDGKSNRRASVLWLSESC